MVVFMCGGQVRGSIAWRKNHCDDLRRNCDTKMMRRLDKIEAERLAQEEEVEKAEQEGQSEA